MVSRSLRLAASLAVVGAALTACSSEAPDPVGVQTVRLAVIANAKHGGKPYSLHMTQEVTSSPVYSGDGTGTALLTVNHGQRTVCWELSVSDVASATAAHIHKAPSGVRGGIVVFLTAPDASGHSSGCDSNLDKALVKDILTNPAEYYVNVHTTQYPMGAVRAQLDQ